MRENGRVLGRVRVVRKCVHGVGGWSSRDTVFDVVWRSELQQRNQLPSLLARQWYGRCRAFNDVLVEVYEHEIIFRQLDILIAAFDSDNVGTRGLQSLDQSDRKDRDEDARPFERI